MGKQRWFAKFVKEAFLQNTSGWLLLLLAFQKQPPEAFHEKICTWKFHKFHRKTALVGEIFKNTFFFGTPLDDCFWLFHSFFYSVSKDNQILGILEWQKTIVNDSFDLITSIFQQGKRISGRGHLTNSKINALQCFYSNALRNNKGSPENMLGVTKAILKHYCSTVEKPQHDYCYLSLKDTWVFSAILW